MSRLVRAYAVSAERLRWRGVAKPCYGAVRRLRYFTVICRIQNMTKKYLRLWKYGRGALGYTKKVSDFEGLKGRLTMCDI